MERQEMIVVGPGEGKTLGVAGGRYTIKAYGDDTGGRYALMEMLVPPGGGPPPHVHSRELEAFYVLEGELAVQIGDRRLTAGPGAFLLAPVAVPHSFANEGNIPARALLLVAPAGLEKFFQEVGQPVEEASHPPASGAPPDLDQIKATGNRYGISFPGPEEKPEP